MNDSMVRRGIALAVTALACGASVAPAQTAEPAMVPLELVEELSIPFAGRGSVEVLVGRLPEPVARALPMAAEGRVIGSFVYDRYSISAVEVPGSRGQVHRELVAGLLGSGWTRLEFPGRRGGFESTPREGLQFCLGDSTTLNLDLSTKRRGSTIVRVTNATEGSRSACAHRESFGFERRDNPIPSLYPPAGAESRGGMSGGGGDSWSAEGRVETDLNPTQLVDHYTAQLVDHGWTPLERAATEDAALQTFTFTHSDGKAWHGLLVAQAPMGGRDRPVLLRVSSPDSPRF